MGETPAFQFGNQATTPRRLAQALQCLNSNTHFLIHSSGHKQTCILDMLTILELFLLLYVSTVLALSVVSYMLLQ